MSRRFLGALCALILVATSFPINAASTIGDDPCHKQCFDDYNFFTAQCERELEATLPAGGIEFFRENRNTYIMCLAGLAVPSRVGAAACLALQGYAILNFYFQYRFAMDQYALCRDVHDSNLWNCSRRCYRASRPRTPCKQKGQTGGGLNGGKPCSPLVLDMAGNGFNLTSLTNGVTFDMEASGVPQKVSWTDGSSDEAFLVYDANANGLVDDGSELFGTATPQPEVTGLEPNGFDALAQYDTAELGGNEDGLITAADRLFQRLLLWRDANHDGNSQASELQTLTTAGVTALELQYTTSTQFDSHGNELTLQSHYWTKSGVRRSLVDVYFFLTAPTPLNFYPNAATDSARTPAGVATTVNVLANDLDRDGNPLTLLSVGTPLRGTASVVSATSIRYTPPAGYVGPDEVRYRIRDSLGFVSEGLVRVLVEGERTITYGNPTDKPITGDWNGDGIEDLGVYRPSDASFYLAAVPGFAGAIIRFGFNNPEDVPIVGDWTGSGRDQIGLYRRTTSQFFLNDNNAMAYPGRVVTYGAPGSVPIIGHWDGGAVARLGTWNSSTAVFTLQNGPPPFAFGTSGDVPLAGDWDGDQESDVAVFRPSEGRFYVRKKYGTVSTIVYGQTGDKPVAGDWTGAGYEGLGVVRSNVFRLNVVTKP